MPLPKCAFQIVRLLVLTFHFQLFSKTNGLQDEQTAQYLTCSYQTVISLDILACLDKMSHLLIKFGRGSNCQFCQNFNIYISLPNFIFENNIKLCTCQQLFIYDGTEPEHEGHRVLRVFLLNKTTHHQSVKTALCPPTTPLLLKDPISITQLFPLQCGVGDREGQSKYSPADDTSSPTMCVLIISLSKCMIIIFLTFSPH